jgi:hypothetical protein
MKSAFPSQNLWKRPLCNIHRNKWCITRVTQPERRLLCWSLIAITSRILALKLTASLRVLISNLSWLQALAWLPLIVLAYRSPQPSVLLGSNLSSSHVGPPSSKYPTWWRCTFQAMSFDITCDFNNHSVWVIQGSIVSDRYHCGSASVTLYPTWDPNDICESSRLVQCTR